MSGSILMLTTISINLETLFVESHFLFNFRSMNSWKNHTLKNWAFLLNMETKRVKSENRLFQMVEIEMKQQAKKKLETNFLLFVEKHGGGMKKKVL